MLASLACVSPGVGFCGYLLRFGFLFREAVGSVSRCFSSYSYDDSVWAYSGLALWVALASRHIYRSF